MEFFALRHGRASAGHHFGLLGGSAGSPRNLERFFAAATRTAGLAGERIKSMPVLNWLEMGLGVSCLAHIVWQMSLNQSLAYLACLIHSLE